VGEMCITRAGVGLGEVGTGQGGCTCSGVPCASCGQEWPRDGEDGQECGHASLHSCVTRGNGR